MRSIIPVLGFLALPIAEIAAFIYVGQSIGVLRTIGLVVLSAIVGVSVLRYQGLSAFRKINREIRSGQPPEQGLADGFMIAIAALLLIVPGFITDIIGLLLLVPPLRRMIWIYASRNMRVTTYYGGHRRGRRRPDDYVDLSPEDYRREDDAPSNGPRLDKPD
ncbi:FxsA family protein [Rhizobium sp. KVB221]|uniref:FxsA family protein n=1 Tax=Rhizobium setariae TaxID=2801340 RepID=A0A936YP28_9HYPH|nr:FxsA family protein [Rhizobium setariae]MBL0374159.1 FxsA family protein [Rhizobium setariae]